MNELRDKFTKLGEIYPTAGNSLKDKGRVLSLLMEIGADLQDADLVVPSDVLSGMPQEWQRAVMMGGVGYLIQSVQAANVG